jgi:hypothetical protein
MTWLGVPADVASISRYAELSGLWIAPEVPAPAAMKLIYRAELPVLEPVDQRTLSLQKGRLFGANGDAGRSASHFGEIRQRQVATDDSTVGGKKAQRLLGF